MSASPDPAPPIVTVIIPAYNAAATLAETLESIRAQTLGAWECIVVDDGSRDGTAEIARRVARTDHRVRVVSQANAGPSVARNTGIDTASPRTPWLAFLDSDDTWLPGALESLLAVAADRPDAVGVYGLAEYMDESGRPSRPGVHPLVQQDRRRPGRFDIVDLDVDSDATFDSLVVSGTIWPPGVGIFRRDAVVAAGAFDPEQRLVEDWDLWIRMSRLGPFVPVHEQVVWYRQHGANLTSRSEEMAFYYARVRWKAWKSPANNRAQRRTCRRVWVSLQARMVLWTVEATVAALRGRDAEKARAAFGATLLFARQLVAGRPPSPDVRTAANTARFVADRRGRRTRRPDISETL